MGIASGKRRRPRLRPLNGPSDHREASGHDTGLFEDVAKAPIAKTSDWKIWRGSPELLAHLARVAEMEAWVPGGPNPICAIDVEVAGDHEIFLSPDDFLDNVTSEALRQFRRVTIDARGPRLVVFIEMSRVAHWALPSMWNSRIDLSVRGFELEPVRAAFETVHRALRRGGTDRHVIPVLRWIGIPLVGSVVGLAAVVIVALLTGQASTGADGVIQFANELLGVVVAIAGAAGGLVAGAWAYPSLEIATRGETRLWRLAKYTGGLAVGLAAAAVAQQVFA